MKRPPTKVDGLLLYLCEFMIQLLKNAVNNRIVAGFAKT